MRMKITILVVIVFLLGIITDIFVGFPAIYAWNHHLNFFRTWYYMIVPVIHY